MMMLILILLLVIPPNLVHSTLFYPFLSDRFGNYLTNEIADFKQHLIENSILFLNVHNLTLQIALNDGFLFRSAIIERNDSLGRKYVKSDSCGHFVGEILNSSNFSLAAISICANQIVITSSCVRFIYVIMILIVFYFY